MPCTRCGQCCTYTEFHTPNDAVCKEDAKWWANHGHTVTQHPHHIAIRVNNPCNNLRHNKDKTTYCTTYQNRPSVCRNFKCFNSQGGTMKEKLEARKQVVTEENNKLDIEFKKLNEQGAALNRRVSEIKARFDGNVRVIVEIDEMLKEDPPAKVTKLPKKAG